MLQRIKASLERRSGRYVEALAMRPLAHSFRDQYGYINSCLAKRPVDTLGQPIPWFTYPAIEFLDSLDLAEAAVFEWGSGNSSAWFSSRCRSIESVESDRDWFDYQIGILKQNQKITFASKRSRDYVNAIEAGNEQKYDIIVVDGDDQRSECCSAAISRLNPSGFLVLDNADWYPVLCDSLRGSGFIQIDFHGHGPINPYTWTTSLFLPAGSAEPKANLVNRRKTLLTYSKSGLVQTAADDAALRSNMEV